MNWGNLKMIHEMCDEPEYFGERASDAGMAYQEGYRKGFADAMREASGYGQRERMPESYGERRYYPEPGMRETRDPYMGMRDGYQDDMGERRRRRSNGQWY